MRTIILTAAAAKDLDGLPDDDRERVSEALSSYAIDGRGDVKRLTGREAYRLRVGRYRVIFNQDQSTILAIYVGKRETTTYRRH